MRAVQLSQLVLVVLIACGANAGRAEMPATDHGRVEYLNSCSGCHGDSGRGDGHFSAFLNRPPADLTLLERRNAGVFPMQRLYETIDGRAVSAHGKPGEMPVWGTVYSAQWRHDAAAGALSPESFVRLRILALLDYLYRIQQR